jgi:hypothetical protein
MFSLLPLVLRGSIASVGSAAFMMSAKALPYSGKPPPGVAVPRLIVVFEMVLPPSCAVALAPSSKAPAQTRVADITLLAFIVATLRVNMPFRAGRSL